VKYFFHFKNRSLFWLILVFALLFGLISLVNHYNFKTYALDLGAYTKALWDYAHFHWCDSTVFKAVPENMLADHFDLYLVLFSPLVYLFGTYTLLIIQILFLLGGGIGLYKCLKLYTGQEKTSLWGTYYFYIFFGVFTALSFDYHSNVITAATLPWFFYWVHQKAWKKAILVFIFLLIGKENMSFWMFFVCLGLAWEYRRQVSIRHFLLVGSFVSLIFFVVLIKWIMPAFSNEGVFPHFHYSSFGEDFKGAIFYIVEHPLETIKALFTNHNGTPKGDYVKAELWVFLFLCGLPWLLKKPAYLLMLIPILFQKLLHDRMDMWGATNQYAIEFAPIMAIGVFSEIGKIPSKKWRQAMLILQGILVFSVTFRVMDNPFAYAARERIRIYKKVHYKSHYDREVVKKIMKMIPPDAGLSTESHFLPQLVLRDRIYTYPLVGDAEFLFLDRKSFSEEGLNTGKWELLYDQNELILLKRIQKN